ncbi:toprim domain-containing protein [Hazenella coriacea]|uniref:Toprim domain-containing protein n=1 Tax=Hazenella coriacea TaxID=1179467 RepID=A0A4R3LCI4_9BACL|nr:toprim domain-containing protein [Hazenella coriacea]TCS97018.1 Toprim domain-containing protein [Hazenella coriacea]
MVDKSPSDVTKKFKFTVSPSKRKQFNVVKKLLNEATEIIVITDPNREGENIARSIIRIERASSMLFH